MGCVREREYIEGLAREDPLIDYGVKNEGFPTSFYPHPYQRHKALSNRMNFLKVKKGGGSQSSYLSQISQIIFVEKNLSCGEISDFCKEFEQFVWRKICVDKICVEKK